MARRSLTSDSFFNPEFVCPGCLEPGSLPWVLARFRSTVFPAWLFDGWRGSRTLGRKAWPPVVLMTLLLLRFAETGMSRRASCRRAKTDATWRAALGLNFGAQSPDEKTVREFEQFLRSRHESGMSRILLFHEHVARRCLKAGIAGDDAVWVTDSTPMWCYGAVRDTVRLLGEGIGMLARQWAAGARIPLEQVVRDWDVEWVLAPSVKGAFDIDWSDADARSEVITELGEKAVALVDIVQHGMDKVRRGKRKKLGKLCRHLLTVIEQNLESDESGGLVVAQRVAADRILSLTDPQARHGRKSKSGTFNGFKLHVLGDAVSGLILSLAVTPGNVHDSAPALRLLRRAKRLHRELDVVMADTAYGAAELRHMVGALEDIAIIAPSPPVSNEGMVTRADFGLNLVQGTAICPRGWVTDDIRFVRHTSGRMAPRARWPKQVCVGCPFAPDCPARRRTSGHPSVRFHPFEPELRAIREEWTWPETRSAYRRRSEGERLIRLATRRGARHTMAWGLAAAELQAYLVVLANNLSLLAERLSRAEGLAA